MCLITSVQPNSPAAKARVRPGEALEAINGHPVRDVLDYRFYTYEPKLRLTLRRPNGKPRAVTLRHAEGEDLGLEFASYLMDEHRRCQNHCVFCFIDQMPEGCRESLYVKDDDERLSFLLGNYITLTNLSGEEIQRLITMRVSPLHISVHTTNPALRVKMTGNPRAAQCLELLRRFAQARLTLHAQIVLCPGWNDGAELERTLGDLASLGGSLASVAVVPVGLTARREELPPPAEGVPLRPVSLDEARAAIVLASRYARVYCADELYLTARLPLPGQDAYGEYPQLENGVGMLTRLRQQWKDADKPADIPPQTLVTGAAAAPFLRELLAGRPVDVTAVENRFFGLNVTVAGLLTGRDIAQTLAGRDLGVRVLIPASALRHGTDLFLDGMTVGELEAALGVPVVAVEADGAALAEALGQPPARNAEPPAAVEEQAAGLPINL
ncbi:MAG: DUF512 domain-containing protein [Oscillospiraceae bacterium]|nr:DUF512 domain-containing protein [Oscillospiraceae bacterium]